MAVIKVTSLFELNTVPNPFSVGRVGGWSESWYYTGTIAQAKIAYNGGGGLAALRAALLPAGAAIVGQRYQQVDPPPVGASFSDGRLYPGAAGIISDIPQMALLINVRALVVTRSKLYMLRGVPDDYVKGGEYQPTPPYAAALTSFLNGLATWQFRATDPTLPVIPMTSLNMTTGQGVSAIPNGWAIGETIKFSGLRTVNNPAAPASREVRKLTLTPDATHFNIQGSLVGNSYEQGRGQKVVVIYPFVDPASTTLNRVVVRKVGRPFDLFRGRR